MKIVVYDSNPGPGLKNKFLKLSWVTGCMLRKMLGNIDEYYGADSWFKVSDWLDTKRDVEQIEFWMHGSPGKVWMNGKDVTAVGMKILLEKAVTTKTLVWFRCCSVFRGENGQKFAQKLANDLNCTIAGHTRIVGLIQGGLHTIKPNESPRWGVAEGELSGRLAKIGLKWGNNSIFFWQSSFPKEW